MLKSLLIGVPLIGVSSIIPMWIWTHHRHKMEELRLKSGRIMAEGEGFEPPDPFPGLWFSRPVPSTTRPSFLSSAEYLINPSLCKKAAAFANLRGI